LGTAPGPSRVLLAPAGEGLTFEVVTLGPGDIRADLLIHLVDGPLEVGPVGKRDELDSVDLRYRRVRERRVEHHLVLAAGLAEAAVAAKSRDPVSSSRTRPHSDARPNEWAWCDNAS
jgi:hypothetical protein